MYVHEKGHFQYSLTRANVIVACLNFILLGSDRIFTNLKFLIRIFHIVSSLRHRSRMTDRLVRDTCVAISTVDFWTYIIAFAHCLLFAHFHSVQTSSVYPSCMLLIYSNRFVHIHFWLDLADELLLSISLEFMSSIVYSGDTTYAQYEMKLSSN